MAHRTAGLLVGVALASLTACGTDDGTPAANLTWQFQCETPLNCSPQLLRAITSFDGERGNEVACSGSSDSLGNVRLDFSAENIAGRFGIGVRNVTVNRESLVITSSNGCQTSVVEQNGYQGDCGALPPTPERPCQLLFDEVGGGAIKGFLRCDGIPLRASAASRARVLADGITYDPSGQVRNQGLSFAFSSCDGV